MAEQTQASWAWRPVGVSGFPVTVADADRIFISTRAVTEFIRANEPETSGVDTLRKMLRDFLDIPRVRAARTSSGYWKLVYRGHFIILSPDGLVVTGYGRRPAARGRAVTAEELSGLPVGYLRNDLPAPPLLMHPVTEQTVRAMDPATLLVVSRSRRQLMDAGLLDPQGDVATMAALAPFIRDDLTHRDIHLSEAGHWIVVGEAYLWVLSEDATRLKNVYARPRLDEGLAEELLKEACE